MSDPATPTTNLDRASAALSAALPVVQLVAGMLAPEAAGAVATGVAIAKGVVAGIPEAEALWAEFQSGTVPSQAQLDAYAATEQAAYDQVMADISAALKTTPAA